MTWLRWIVVLVFAVAVVPMSWADTPKKVALVVGNSAYVNEPHLKNPANDAKAMATALRAKGFEVVEAENATKAQFETAIGRFSEALSEGSTGLFYYAGHGMQVDGRNYLLPIDAKIQREERVRIEAVNVDDVISQMTDAKTKVSLVILDACRNNPFEHRFRSIGGGLAQMSAPEGTFIAYATAPGSIAADGNGEHGIYSEALLQAMQKPGLKVEDVFKTVRINVSKTTDGVQVPWESSSLTGDFYFTPAPAGPSAAELAAQAELAKIAAAKVELERQQAALKAAQDEMQKVIAARAEAERLQAAPKDAAKPTAASANASAEPTQQQAVSKLAQAGGGAARALSSEDTQGSFATNLPKFGRIGPIDVQINVQGHRVSGYGVIAGYAIPCSAVGQVEHTAIDFNLICTYSQGNTAGPSAGATNFSFEIKGQLARAEDGWPYFKSSYEGGAEGTHLKGTADLRKVSADDGTGSAQAELAKIAAAKADLERQQAALKDVRAEAAKLAAQKADLERQQAALKLAQASGGAARALGRGDAQGAFATTLPRFGRVGPIDVQINVEGHRVTGYGVMTGYPIPCKAIGQVDHTSIDFDLNCIQSMGLGGGVSGIRNFGFHFKGALAQADDGSIYFKTSYEGGPEGAQSNGTADMRRVAIDDVFGTYVGEIRLSGLGVVQAIITASDGQIAGFSTRGPPCKITGKVEGVHASFVLGCSAGGSGVAETSFNGQFVKENGHYVLKSDFTTGDRETGTLVWTAKK